MKKILATGLVLLFSGGQALALDIGVGVKAGTVGPGVDVTFGLTKTLNARLALTSVDIEGIDETIEVGDEGATGEVDAELNMDFGANALLLDWHVFDGTFHLTAGLMKHNGSVDFTGVLLDNVVIDGEPLSPGDIQGNVGGSVELADTYQPYLGIGVGRKAGDGGGFSISLELGVVLMDPSVSLDATVDTGGINGLDQAELDRRLREMESDAEAELDQLEIWPILSFGVNYAF